MERMCDRIKYYRLRSNQSQQQVADKLGITASNYQKYEHGHREPSEKTLPLLADALGCEVYGLRESDKERFIRTYNKNLREMAMHRWDMYSFVAEDFMAYDIGDDITAFFNEWFDEIEELNPDLYAHYFYRTDTPALLTDLADRIYRIECGKLKEHPEWDEFSSIENEDTPVLFWYFIVFGRFFLNQYTSTTDPNEIAAAFQAYFNEDLDEDDSYSDGEAFDEYIHRVFVPFFDYILTAVEYMVDEHTNLETAIRDTLIGKTGLEITPIDTSLNQPNKETVAALLDAERTAKDPSVKGYNNLDMLFADLEK